MSRTMSSAPLAVMLIGLVRGLPTALRPKQPKAAPGPGDGQPDSGVMNGGL
jgi:hypothetical protein